MSDFCCLYVQVAIAMHASYVADNYPVIIANFCYSRNAAPPKHLQCLTSKADKKLRLPRRGK